MMSLPPHKNCFCAFLFALIFLTTLHAAKKSPLGQAEANWPGVTFEIVQFERLGPDRLLAVIHITAGPTAKNPTFIGIEPVAGWKSDDELTAQEKASGDYDPKPYSLTTATLIEQTTKQQLNALPDVPRNPYRGDNITMTALAPGDWMKVVVQFPAPPPPPKGPDGKLPEQKVTILLPQAKSPIKNIPVPALEKPPESP